MLTHTHTQAHTHTHSNTHTHTHTKTHSDDLHTYSDTHTHSHTHTNTLSFSQICTHSNTHIHRHFHTHTRALPHTCMQTRAHEQLLTSPLMGLVVTQVPVKHCQECMHAPINPSLLKWMQAITPMAPWHCCRTPQWDVSVAGKTLRVYAETQQSASLSNWLMTGTSVHWMVAQDPHHQLRRPGEHLPWILVQIARWSEAASASLSNWPLTRTSVEWVVA